jgi:hypothetical protein
VLARRIAATELRELPGGDRLVAVAPLADLIADL